MNAVSILVLSILAPLAVVGSPEYLAGSENLPLRLLIKKAHELPQDRPVFIICRSGRRSTRAMFWLLDLGFKDVYNLSGGVLSWKSLGKPVEVD